jgi:hypothetical protein
MSHFAQVIDGIVVNVISAEQDFIDTLPNKEQWIQTSYNTRLGVNDREGGENIRKNYAGIGMTYDKVRDAFIPIKPYDSWILNEATCSWESPIPEPIQDTDTARYHIWDENLQEWIITA